MCVCVCVCVCVWWWWGGGLQRTGANNTMTGPEIGNFQNNGNLGNAANLDMVFMGRGYGVPFYYLFPIHEF